MLLCPLANVPADATLTTASAHALRSATERIYERERHLALPNDLCELSFYLLGFCLKELMKFSTVSIGDDWKRGD